MYRGDGFQGAIRGARRVVQLDHVYVRYSGSGRPAIRDVTLSLDRPGLVLIVGPNGAGKTTLIETCLGLLKPFKGRALLFGIDTKSRAIACARRLCSYVPQDFAKPPYESYTVRQVIAMGLASRKTAFEPLYRSEEEEIERVARLLEIEDLLDKPIGKLSGGQQQRVFIARALVRKPLALFLDEPFASIDRESRYRISKIIRGYVDEAKALALIVSHDTEPLYDLADVIIEMDDGIIKRVEGRCSS